MQKFTLGDFFGHLNRDDSTLDKLQKKEVFEELRNKLPEHERALQWKPLWNSVIEHIGKLLDIELPDIMLRAWNHDFDLTKYSDTEAYPPEKTYLEPLFEHAITSRHKPEIVVDIDNIVTKTIAFDIVVQLTLKGFILEITEGKIVKIHTGQCSGKGSVSCMEVTLLQKEFSPITLPQIIDLGDGIPIASSYSHR